jgi:hypothetical protein
MFKSEDKVVRYKWDPRTESGYRLRYDRQRASHGGLRCFRVEDWANHTVMDEWGCNSLDEALGVLRGFFDIDVGQEIHRIEERFPRAAQ